VSIRDLLTAPVVVATRSQGREHIYADGPMADSIRLFPWENTSVREMSGQSEALLIAVNLMLESQFPTLLARGT
jgi:hypothetical protein